MEYGLRLMTNRELIDADKEACKRKCWATSAAIWRELDSRFDRIPVIKTIEASAEM